MTSGHHHHLDHLDHLDHLWHTVLQFAEQVERGVVHAIGALKAQDWEMDHLQLPTDALIDQTQRTIQAEVATLIARHALGPTEVRLIVSTLVVANELAQISGHVEHIVETVAWRVPSPWMDVPGDLADLADRTQLLLCTALHAYAQRNATTARQLIGSGATGDDLPQPQAAETLQFADLRLDTGTREAFREDRRIDLTTREYELLRLFLNYPRQVLTREQILDRVWEEAEVDSNALEVHIARLRSKLEADGESRLIQTVRGAGYTLREEIP